MTINPNAHSSAFLPCYTPNDSPDTTGSMDASALSRNKRGVSTKSALWPQQSIIRISMTGMTKEQEEFTKTHINKWAPHVNLSFEFTSDPDADIRIAADNEIDGGSSYIGTRALWVPAEKPTMVIGFKGGLNDFNAGTVLHEFGHALGLQHEHQHKNRDLDINWSEINKAYVDKGGEEEVKRNFEILDSDVISSDYDRKSVMHYGFSSSWINDGNAIQDNNELSEGDIKFARSLYPPVVEKKPTSSNWWDFRFAHPTTAPRS